MPTIIIDGYKFRFYSSDIKEPPHVHVIHDNDVAKFGLNRSMLNIITATTNPN